MATEKITVYVVSGGEDSYTICRCTILGIAHGRGITTHGSGQANVTHYDVEIAGHEMPGIWCDDARRNVEVSIDVHHPLASACRLIATMQNAWRNMTDMTDVPPIGWRNNEWDDAQMQAEQDYHVAKRAAESDPIAATLIAATLRGN